MGAISYNKDHQFTINSRVRVGNDVGTIKYIGEVENYKDIWLGVEWDDPNRGKHDGTVNGVKYFKSNSPTSCSFIRPNKINAFESVQEAIESKYMSNDEDVQFDDELMRETQKRMRSSIFEVVGVNKVGKKQSDLNLLNQVFLAKSSINSVGDLSRLKHIIDLDLTSSLIWQWRTVGEIVRQLPTLEFLTISENRILLPHEREIPELEPYFRHLKNINLRKCNLSAWCDVMQLAKLWPNIESISLAENNLVELMEPNEAIFKNLILLDLQKNCIKDFGEIVKLGEMKSLTCLNISHNLLTNLNLPDCAPTGHLQIFENLLEINIKDNPIVDELSAYNELDKLPALIKLGHKEDDFDKMFQNATSRISNLKCLNNALITDNERRGAEYDLWKEFGLKWISLKIPEEILKFSKEFRAYPRFIAKYGSPEDLIKIQPKKSNLITIKIQTTAEPIQTFSKRVPLKMSVQVLHGIVKNLLKLSGVQLPTLSYVDAKCSDIRVVMDNLMKDLDYYSIQDGDTVLVEI